MIMKKKLTFLFLSLLAIGASAQTDSTAVHQADIIWPEDTAKTTTVDNIIQEQQEVTMRNNNIKHFNDVWSRNSYVNLSFNKVSLTPKEPIATGVPYNGGIAPDFKSDWAAGIQVGRSYKLHKKPIANTLMFFIDYTYIDLNVNHYKKENDGKDLYDSSNKFTKPGESDEYYYMPWNLQKYELTYGMSVGPSITIAPFTHLNSPGLHFLKLNLYYHIGYHASLIWMTNDEDADINQNDDEDHKKMKDNIKLSLGHGLTQSFGFSLSWKVIGLGFEYCSAPKKHTALGKSDFGGVDFKFKSSTSRFFIQFRM
jgi:hypothetical protein